MLRGLLITIMTMAIVSAATAQSSDVDSDKPFLKLAESANDLKSLNLMQSQQACAGLSKDAESGIYYLNVSPAGQPVQTTFVFCNNEIEASGRVGGWTLVWSNLRGGRDDPSTDLSWGASIQTLPRYTGTFLPQDPNVGLQSFEVFTGLRWWTAIAGQGSDAELVYEWAANYSSPRNVDQRAFCEYRLDSYDSYSIRFNSNTCLQLIGAAGLPGLFVSHSGARWSTMDRDNDIYTGHCAQMYSRTPFWYQACWSGSINGGGEDYGGDHSNGAYWTGSATGWASPQPDTQAEGAGSGWIYIRPLGAGHPKGN